jgi:hypothetical protein
LVWTGQPREGERRIAREGRRRIVGCRKAAADEDADRWEEKRLGCNVPNETSRAEREGCSRMIEFAAAAAAAVDNSLTAQLLLMLPEQQQQP